jgi:hypothetical protein
MPIIREDQLTLLAIAMAAVLSGQPAAQARDHVLVPTDEVISQKSGAPEQGEVPSALVKPTELPSSTTRQSDRQDATPGSSAAQNIFNSNSPEKQELLDAERGAARDNLFVKYLSLSCAAFGAIIAFAVWRSMPPKPKTNTDEN